MNFSTSMDMAAYPFVVAPATQQPSQSSSIRQINQINNTIGGFFVVFLLLIYIYVGLRYKKHRKTRSMARQEQIETLERIWKMTAHRKI